MQKWDYLYSGGSARVLMGLAEYGRSGNVFCVGSGQIKLLKEYIHLIYEKINGYDESDEKIGIGLRPYMDKQVMYLQADISEWTVELQQEFKERPMCSFEKGISQTIDWVNIYRV